MAADSAVQVTLWTDAARAATAAAVLARMGERVRPIGVGGPRVAAVTELATRWGCLYRDDFRQLVVERPSPFVLVASLEALEPTDLLAATGQGGTVVTLDPAAADLQALATLTGASAGAFRSLRSAGAGDAGRIVVVPAFSQCPGFVRAADPIAAIGGRRMVAHQSVGPAACGSLFARLFDGWRTVLRFADMPESVDAALVGTSSREAVPQELGDLTGAMTAHGRMPDGSAAVLHAADCAAAARRCLHALGDEGELRVSDGGYSLWHLDGRVLDQHAPGATVDYAELVARHWQRLLGRPTPPDEASLHADGAAAALACCLACLLSARTGQPESPWRALQMNR